MASLETEIALQARSLEIEALSELRDCERATGAALRFLIAPIRTLPIELLAEIFVLTIRKVSHMQDAYRVSHVCGHWRRVAHGTPRLWTGPLCLSLEADAESEETYADGLRAWLARSALLPVPIYFTTQRPWHGGHILEEVLDVAFRWRSLCVFASLPVHLARRLADIRLEALEELQLPAVIVDFDPTGILSFAAAPRLRKLTINVDCRIPMPWAQLTDITLTTAPSLDICLGIVVPCTNLVKLSLVARGSILPPAEDDILVFHHLRVLSIAFARGDSGATEVQAMLFMGRLSAPALDDLQLNLECAARIQWDEDTFTAFQSRSPNISKLEIKGYRSYLPATALRAALVHAPSLTHLCLHRFRHSVDDALLSDLCYTDGVQPLLPRLHNLSLTWVIGAGTSKDLLVSLFASRWWTDADLASRPPSTVARWTRIKLGSEVFSAFGQGFRARMEELRKAGLIIERG
ncbi:hypothetical protein DFH08DRAFT_834087 [Mycena albidolilacea]|uniref:F-box domain-containing protein n=1 Tax=Mycena albidolilacea TaxID=1033008 RepID=A0AAD7AR30_9AGAR|nr:hypothetical protein DFH08DRAFT_834087 [Mycena albidolilacea]